MVNERAQHITTFRPKEAQSIMNKAGYETPQKYVVSARTFLSPSVYKETEQLNHYKHCARQSALDFWQRYGFLS